MITVFFAYLGIACLWFYNTLSGNLIFIERDLSAFFIPPRYLWVHLIKSFQFPFWNPHNFSGIPLLATLQPGILYPPQVCYLFLPFPLVWNWIILIHFAFSGFTLWLLLRHLGVSIIAAFAGGLIFMLSGYLISVHSLLTHLLAIPWLCLAVLFILKNWRTEKPWCLVACAVCLSLELMAGAIEIVLMTCLVLFVVTVFRDQFLGAETDVLPTRKSMLGRVKDLAIVMGLFVLFSAPQLILFYELKQNSVRASGLSYAEAITWSFAWRDFLLFFMPDAFGYFQSETKYWANQSWLKTMYLGFGPFVLSGFYLFTGKDRRKWILIALIVISFVIALGGHTILYRFFYQLPPFNAIRYPVKFLALFFVVISMMAAFGIDQLREGIRVNDRRVALGVRIVLVAGLICALSWGLLYCFETQVTSFLDDRGFKPERYNDIVFNLHNLRRCLFFSFFFSITLVVCLRVRHRRLTLIMLVASIGLDLFLANYGFHGVLPWKAYMSRDGFVDVLSATSQQERYVLTLKSVKEFKNFPLDRAVFAPSYTALFGAYSLGGSEVMRLSHQEYFFNMLNGVSSIEKAERLFDVSGVRFLVTSYEVYTDHMRKVASIDIADKKAYLYEYTSYPGRFLLYGKARHVSSDAEAAKVLLDDGTDLRKEIVLVSGRTGTTDYGEVKGFVEPLALDPNRLAFRFTSDGPAFLYVSDSYYPGWECFVDGKAAPILRSNITFRAVQVPGGSHTVVFRYFPRAFSVGLAMMALGLLLSVGLLLRDHYGKKAGMAKEQSL